MSMSVAVSAVPVEGVAAWLIFNLAYLNALFIVGVMIYLAFRTRADYHDAVYYLFGTLALLLFAFGWGGENFMWPMPGVIWLAGLTFLTFMTGLTVGWLLPSDADVLVRESPQSDR